MEVGSLGLQGGCLWPKEAMTFDGRFECRFTYSLEFQTRMKKGIQNSNSRNGEVSNRFMALWILRPRRIEGCPRERNCKDGIGNGLLEIS